jgi:hypothetical protein
VPVRSLSKSLVILFSEFFLSPTLAHAVHVGIPDPKYEYLYDITEGFCERKEIKAKYIPLVPKLCPQLLDEENGWRNTFVMPFESESCWDDIVSSQKLLPKTKQVTIH